MDNSNGIVERLRSKVNQVIEQNVLLESENARLAAQNDKLQRNVRDHEDTIAELNGKINRLMMSKSLTEVEGGVKSAKARVNHLLREIDKCMAILNR